MLDWKKKLNSGISGTSFRGIEIVYNITVTIKIGCSQDLSCSKLGAAGLGKFRNLTQLCNKAFNECCVAVVTKVARAPGERKEIKSQNHICYASNYRDYSKETIFRHL